MQKESAKTLPKILSGVVLSQMVRCGRLNCCCAQGKPHGPYFYRFYREDGRLRKAYVRPADVEQVREACEARRQHRRDLRAALTNWRQMVEAIREMEGRS